MSILLFREYDAGVAARFTPETVTPAGQPPHYEVTVPGLAAPVALGVGVPAEWFTKFTLPYISITRGVHVLAPMRQRPAFRAQQPNAADATKVDVAQVAPIAVSIPYTVELMTATMADMNALEAYLQTVALPPFGFGTEVTVLGNAYTYQGDGAADKTNYGSTDGRIFRRAYSYVIDGWLFTLDADTYAQVASIDMTIEAFAESVDLTTVPPPSQAVEVTEVVLP